MLIEARIWFSIAYRPIPRKMTNPKDFKLKIKVAVVGHIHPDEHKTLCISSPQNGKVFSEMGLDHFTVIETELTNCSFIKIRAESACFGEGMRQTVYNDCLFDHCNLRLDAPGNARFIRCKFANCVFSEMFATSVEFIDCEFPSTKFKGGVFHGRLFGINPHRLQRETNEFRGNDFSTAEFLDIDFRGGIDLKKQRLPTSDNYLYIPDIRAASKALDEMRLPAADQELNRIRKRLKTRLDLYKDDLQKDQLLRIDFPPLFRYALARTR